MKVLSTLLDILTGILIFVVSLLGFSALWTFSKWGAIDMDEIIFQLQQPLQGAGDDMIMDFILKAALPTVLILAAYIVVLCLIRKFRRKRIFTFIVLGLVLISGFFVKQYIWNNIDMEQWIEGQLKQSAFIEENYVDPQTVAVTFPETKRNLIYIYLESMETTYADTSSGGAFPENMIPELTRLAQENEDFSGNTAALNGGLVYSGTAFTTGAMFAHSAGLPLKISIGGNNMDTQKSFFPNVTALGDLLKEQGYQQVFLCGSDAVFGGRQLFLETHGNFQIRDLTYGRENGWVEPDYFNEWWGFEDEVLFRNAREVLLELVADSRPFNLTLLTVDTHFEDGYLCDLCQNEFADNQYANVMACSSRQVSEFVEWIQQQDFYENTTIVLAGDHTTMDYDFCENVNESYQRRSYVSFIHSAVSPEQPDRTRQYSTMDLFPTTLASLGAVIEGNRLALGTNLFSSVDTLTEEFGAETVKAELIRKSAFLDELEKTEMVDNEVLLNRYHDYFSQFCFGNEFDEKKGTLTLLIYEEPSTVMDIDSFEAVCIENGSDTVQKVTFQGDDDHIGIFTAVIDLSQWKSYEGTVSLNIHQTDDRVIENVVTFSVEELIKQARENQAASKTD